MYSELNNFQGKEANSSPQLHYIHFFCFEIWQASEGKEWTMKKNEIEQVEKIKRIKALNKFLLFIAKGKIGFKEIDAKKHLTLKFLNEGIADVHETIEGRIEEKEHRRLGILDVRAFAKTYQEFFRKEVLTFFKEIDVNSSRFQNIEVCIIPPKEELKKKLQVHKKTIKIENSDLDVLFPSVPIKELPAHDFRVAFMTDGNQICAVYHIDEKYYSIKLDDLRKIMEKIIKKIFIPNNVNQDQ
jgi:hypothetical protein